MPADAFADPVWNALHSAHRQLAVVKGLACKYARDVTPFAALAENSVEAMGDLRYLLEPEEVTYVIGAAPPGVEGVRVELGPLCLQMVIPPEAVLPEVSLTIATLTCADSGGYGGAYGGGVSGVFSGSDVLDGELFWDLGGWEAGGYGGGKALPSTI